MRKTIYLLWLLNTVLTTVCVILALIAQENASSIACRWLYAMLSGLTAYYFKKYEVDEYGSN